MPDPVPETVNYQARYQQRWGHLRNCHVRSLAWLLDSPALLNESHPRWANCLAQLPAPGARVHTWLAELDAAPQALQAALALHPHTRLGHYAENLLAFYFSWKNELVAHSVQVRSHTTLGEFDFLLNTPEGFAHWEFACKFYLFAEPATELAHFVGPNLMDNLSDKSHKIMNVQLALGRHPEAKKYLAEPLRAAKALLKGWLFYRPGQLTTLPEIGPDHCRGLWCRLTEFAGMSGDRFVILPRLTWLAPARAEQGSIVGRDELCYSLTAQFATDARPVLVAQLRDDRGDWVESERIFLVPDDWNLHSTPSA